MAPIDNNAAAEAAQQATAYAPLRENMSDDSQILEAWGEGWNVGAMIILILIVICNYRRKNILHKLIALEVRCYIIPFYMVFCWLLSFLADSHTS